MKIHKKATFSIALVSILAFGLIGLSSWKKPLKKRLLMADTTQKKKESQHSKKPIIIIDENGKAHEQIVENIDGDEGLRESWGEDMDFEFDFPPMPDFDIDIPDMPQGFMVAPFPDEFYEIDSTAFGRFDFDGPQFEGFADMMPGQFESFGPEFEARMEAMQERLEGMDFGLDSKMEELNERLEDQLSRLDEHLSFDLDHRMKNLNEELSRFDKYASSWDNQVKKFETAALEELVKDGYLKESEKIENMNWSGDEIKFNGKAIKDEHKAKYRELREKYLKRNPHRGRPE